MATVNTAGRTILPLTGMRFFAAMAVVAYHFGPPWIHWYGSIGHIAVTLFFVLSGFVLALSRASSGPSPQRDSARSFWVARLARIYPAYLLALIASIPMLVQSLNGFSPRDGLKCLSVLTLTQSWFVTPAMFWNFPAWSLSDEAFFYAVFPLIIGWVRRLEGNVLRTLGVVFLLNVGCGALYLMSPRFTFQVFPLVRLPQFVFGMVLGRAFVLRSSFLGKMESYAGSIAAISIAGLVCITILSGPNLQSVPLIVLLMPLSGTLIYSLALGGGWLRAPLSHPVAVLLGEASYSIYILQAPVFWWVLFFARRYGFDWPIFPLGAAVLVLASIASFLLVETPLRKKIYAALSGAASTGAHPTPVRLG